MAGVVMQKFTKKLRNLRKFPGIFNIQENKFFTEEWHDNNFEDLIKCIQKLILAIKTDKIKNDKKNQKLS